MREKDIALFSKQNEYNESIKQMKREYEMKMEQRDIENVQKIAKLSAEYTQ